MSTPSTVLKPVPATTGIRPFAAFTDVATTCSISSADIEYISPVPPAATSAQNGNAAISSTLRARPSRSSDRSSRKGVTGKPNTPLSFETSVRCQVIALCVHCLHQPSNITVSEGKSLPAAGIALNDRNVIGHQNAVITHFFVDFQHRQHIDIAAI